MEKKKLYLQKLILLTLTFLLSACLSGCGILSTVDQKLKENKTKSDDKYWAGRGIPPVELDLEVSGISDNLDFRVSRCVYKYLEEGDLESLKKMFAPSVLNTDEELDSELEALLSFYKELEVSGYVVETNSVYKINHIDPREVIVEYTFHTKIIYNEEEYNLDIMYVEESTIDEALLGVHGIRLRKRGTDHQATVNTVATDI